MSRRLAQIASTLRRAIQSVFVRGLSDPRIKGSVSVTDVRVDPDLREATVFVSVTPEEAEAATMNGLHAAAKHIRHEVAAQVRLARVPGLRFKLDTSLKEQARVLELIARGVQELKERDASAEPDGQAASPTQTEQEEKE